MLIFQSYTLLIIYLRYMPKQGFMSRMVLMIFLYVPLFVIFVWVRPYDFTYVYLITVYVWLRDIKYFDVFIFRDLWGYYDFCWHEVISKVHMHILKILVTSKIGWSSGSDDVGGFYLPKVNLSVIRLSCLVWVE